MGSEMCIRDRIMTATAGASPSKVRDFSESRVVSEYIGEDGGNRIKCEATVLNWLDNTYRVRVKGTGITKDGILVDIVPTVFSVPAGFVDHYAADGITVIGRSTWQAHTKYELDDSDYDGLTVVMSGDANGDRPEPREVSWDAARNSGCTPTSYNATLG